MNRLQLQKYPAPPPPEEAPMEIPTVPLPELRRRLRASLLVLSEAGAAAAILLAPLAQHSHIAEA